jgi:hypothetical protein
MPIVRIKKLYKVSRINSLSLQVEVKSIFSVKNAR